MKKILFGIALILFGFSMAYISWVANWGVMQVISLAAIFLGLAFSVYGFVEKEK